MENSKRKENKASRFRKGHRPWNKGIKGKNSHSYGTIFTQERKDNISKSLKLIWDKKGRLSKNNELIRKSREYIDWRRAVFKRDKYTCQKCGDNKDLHPHHIKEFAKYKELRFDVSNGITLCDICHGKIHGIDFKKRKKKLTCKNCNVKFSVKEGHYNHKFCSKRCGYNYRSKVPSPKKGKQYPHLIRYPIKTCPVCSIEFKAVVHKTRNQIYCSRKCYLDKRFNRLTGEKGQHLNK